MGSVPTTPIWVRRADVVALWSECRLELAFANRHGAQPEDGMVA